MRNIPPFLRPAGVLDFRQPEVPTLLAVDFDLPPEKAIEWFKAKGLKPTFSYADMYLEEHDKSFTVAKMMDADLLSDMRESLDRAMAEGKTFKQFADDIVPTLQAKGWWGKRTLIDPATGAEVKAQLGSPARLRTIFRSNMQSSLSVGHWQQAKANQDVMPYLRYDAIEDEKTRDSHRAMDGIIKPVDSPWWDAYYPPNGYNCRCSVVPLSQADLEANGWSITSDNDSDFGTFKWTNPRTGRTHKIPANITPGWNHNPGKSQVDLIAQLADEKIAAMPWSDLRTAAMRAKGIPLPTIRERIASISAAGTVAASTAVGSPTTGASELLTRRSQPIDVMQVEVEDLERIDFAKIPEARIGKRYLDMYHVTDTDAFENILKDGKFKASADNQFQGFDSAVQGTYGWATLERGLLELHRSIENDPSLAEHFVLVKVRVPISKFKARFRPDEDFSLDPGDWRESYRQLQSVAVEGDLPASYVSSVTTAGSDPYSLQEMIDELVDIVDDE